jgi:hypothetical protein
MFSMLKYSYNNKSCACDWHSCVSFLSSACIVSLMCSRNTWLFYYLLDALKHTLNIRTSISESLNSITCFVTVGICLALYSWNFIPRTRIQNNSTLVFLSITNKMQCYRIFFITFNAIHVSGGFSAHHQELKNCTHSIGYMSLAVAASKLDIHLMLCVLFYSSWWWAEKPPETRRALTNKEYCIMLHLVGYISEYINDAQSHECQTVPLSLQHDSSIQ